MATVSIVVLSLWAISATTLWRLSAVSVRKLMERWIRANGQFMACDAELNRLKVAHAKTLMLLEDRHK